MLKIDPLTGLYNHRVLKQIRSFSATVMIDIDNFKVINDMLGHQTGDIVLQQVAKILKISIRINDYAIRIGGDEYLIIFDNCPVEVIESRIQKIREQVQKVIKLPNLNVSLSAGIATRENNESLVETIMRSDSALCASKNNGKDQITFAPQKKLVKPNQKN